ncbi:carbohydrate-binding domain-containing protein, partial [Roseomonas sp. BN140053]|uniref:carbohydrate-binding domain-containing protein n=1 Tax=Roseomonas sp. BN140053 TaxID=3391898 RepID=UPI0039EBD579
MTQLGVYVGNDPGAVNNFEQWLGRPVDAVLGYVGHANWGDFVGSANWAATQLWTQINRPILWSVPLTVNGASLEAGAWGAYDAFYRSAANSLASFRPEDEHIYIRTGWEFNGDWFPWSAQGHEQAFIDTFRHFVDTFRSVSDRFVFEWNVNNTDHGMNPEAAYPGDAYVDVIGMDFYQHPQWTSYDASKAFDVMVDRPQGLRWLENFADAHGKPTAYSEWGVQGNNSAAYVQKAAGWFKDHDVVYQTFWNSDADYPGKLSDGSEPATGAAYKAAFPATSGGNAPSGASGTLVVRLSEDAYQGHAQFTVAVDGQTLGGVQTVTASHAAGQMQDFTFGVDFNSGNHRVSVNFLNDANGGLPGTDRNLYVDSISLDGRTYADSSVSLYSAGAHQFILKDKDLASLDTSGKLVLRLSEDAYQGHAQFTVSVDGKQLGGVQTATASHAAGRTQDFAFD